MPIRTYQFNACVAPQSKALYEQAKDFHYSFAKIAQANALSQWKKTGEVPSPSSPNARDLVTPHFVDNELSVQFGSGFKRDTVKKVCSTLSSFAIFRQPIKNFSKADAKNTSEDGGLNLRVKALQYRSEYKKLKSAHDSLKKTLNSNEERLKKIGEAMKATLTRQSKEFQSYIGKFEGEKKDRAVKSARNGFLANHRAQRKIIEASLGESFKMAANGDVTWVEISAEKKAEAFAWLKARLQQMKNWLHGKQKRLMKFQNIGWNGYFDLFKNGLPPMRLEESGKSFGCDRDGEAMINITVLGNNATAPREERYLKLYPVINSKTEIQNGDDPRCGVYPRIKWLFDKSPKILSIEIKEIGNGFLQIDATVEFEERKQKPRAVDAPMRIMGVDLGILHLATCSVVEIQEDGLKMKRIGVKHLDKKSLGFDLVKKWRYAMRSEKISQTRLQKQIKKTGQRPQNWKEILQRGDKLSNFTESYARLVGKRIADYAIEFGVQAVCFEDLSQIMSNVTTTLVNQQISAGLTPPQARKVVSYRIVPIARWFYAKVRDYAIQKLKENGIQDVLHGSPSYTSEKCPECHALPAKGKSFRNLKERLFHCAECGYKSSDDAAAAVNIIQRCIASGVGIQNTPEAFISSSYLLGGYLNSFRKNEVNPNTVLTEIISRSVPASDFLKSELIKDGAWVTKTPKPTKENRQEFVKICGELVTALSQAGFEYTSGSGKNSTSMTHEKIGRLMSTTVRLRDFYAPIWEALRDRRAERVTA